MLKILWAIFCFRLVLLIFFNLWINTSIMLVFLWSPLGTCINLILFFLQKCYFFLFRCLRLVATCCSVYSLEFYIICLIWDCSFCFAVIISFCVRASKLSIYFCLWLVLQNPFGLLLLVCEVLVKLELVFGNVCLQIFNCLCSLFAFLCRSNNISLYLGIPDKLH